MENTELVDFINRCTDDLTVDKPILYEAYFLKIYVYFEHYLAEMFEKYCLGTASSQGYIPNRRLNFDNIDQLRHILCAGEHRNYIDYIAKIKSLSQYIFNENPFVIILEDADNTTLINQMTAIRNYIAHESDFSKKKYQDMCLPRSDYKPVGEFLVSVNRRRGKSFFTIYTEKIIEISNALIMPITE